MTVKEFIKSTGMTQKQLSERFGIPRRTIEDWSRGVSKCPEYVVKMMQEVLDRDKEEEKSMHDAIRLVYARGEAEYVKGQKPDVFDACFGADSDPTEVARFSTEEEARKALKEHKAPRAWITGTTAGRVWTCEAYALEFYKEGEDGEFIAGSDYDYLDPVIEDDEA